VAGVFGGGFYVGTRYHANQIAERPELCFELVGEKVKSKANNQIEKLKESLLGE
jgi:hypothetical protein